MPAKNSSKKKYKQRDSVTKGPTQDVADAVRTALTKNDYGGLTYYQRYLIDPTSEQFKFKLEGK